MQELNLQITFNPEKGKHSMLVSFKIKLSYNYSLKGINVLRFNKFVMSILGAFCKEKDCWWENAFILRNTYSGACMVVHHKKC